MKFRHRSSRSLSLSYLQVIRFVSLNLLWLQANASGNKTDQLALLKFKEGVSSDPHGILNSWNESLPFCNWLGITCSRRHRRVTSLDLQGQNLYGAVSPYIGNLSFLRFINLQNNSFRGEIPQEVGNLFRLQQLMLTNNTLEGKIPVNLTHCSQLRIISLRGNNIVGKIPMELGSLTKLEGLRLSRNNLTGKIPPSLGNLSSLTFLSVANNNLVGHIPNDMGRLASLTIFYVNVNKLSGITPPSLFNISSIIEFSVSLNQLDGSLPDNIGLTLPNVQDFLIAANGFNGPLPTSLANASQLQRLVIAYNNFVGQVPTNLGSLQNLRWLGLAFNNLGSKSTNDLDFLTSLKNCSNLEILDFANNNLGGVLLKSVANLSIQLRELRMGRNLITGIIPAALENLVNLVGVAMGHNLFTGVIPFYFGKFPELQFLSLKGNRLSGQIPSSIGNLSQLSELLLDQNSLEGSIPSRIQNCQNLISLDVSRNHLSGPIPQELLGISSLSKSLNLSQNLFTGNLPAEIGKLKAINRLDVSENSLSGKVPSTIGDCLSLEYLYMQGNSFRGTIPSSLASLKGLRQLDLSRNNLTGEIPQDLQNIRFFKYLNLSFNDLEGEVPTRGVFRNASLISLIGNRKLCGGVPELHLPKCPTNVTKKGKSRAVMITIIIISVSLCVLLVLGSLALLWMRKSKKESPSATVTMGVLVEVSYRDICQATAGFSPDNFIGSGSFGSVYRGILHQVERPVAVKVLNLEKKGASKGFIAECKVLRNIRHRNLVKILTYCSSLDYKGNEFKALVYELMANGSLEKWLHPAIDSQCQSRSLILSERLDIAIHVASVLHYLHDLCETAVIHCDLKPSNILLDNEMIAHVGDFGLARLISAVNDFSESKTSETGIKGTIGYAAPEYGMGGEASKQGDVYSYGILVLEMFTGKRPTDETFKDGLNLRDFVMAALPEKLLHVVDTTLLQRDVEGREVARDVAEQKNDDEIVVEDETNNNETLSQMRSNVRKCLLSMLDIGIACSAELPRDRMNMGEVTRELHSIKKVFLGTQIHRGRPRTRNLRGA